MYDVLDVGSKLLANWHDCRPLGLIDTEIWDSEMAV